MSLGPSYVRLAARVPARINDQLTNNLSALTSSIKSLAGSSSQANEQSIILETFFKAGGQQSDQQSDPSNSSVSFIDIPSKSSSSSGESDSDSDDQDFRKRDEDDDITDNLTALTDTIKSIDDSRSQATEPSIRLEALINKGSSSGESNSDSDDQDFRKRDAMSLGPSFVHLAARIPDDDDDITTNISALTNTIKSSDDSSSKAVEEPGAADSIEGLFDNVDQESDLGSFTDIPSDSRSSSGESDSDSGDQDFRKRDEGSRFLELPNLGKLADYLGNFFSGDYNPDRYLSQFNGRDEDHPALLKTYQKLHRALKAVAARDLD